MLNKLICFLFGHNPIKTIGSDFSFESETLFSSHCSCCNKNLGVLSLMDNGL